MSVLDANSTPVNPRPSHEPGQEAAAPICLNPLFLLARQLAVSGFVLLVIAPVQIVLQGPRGLVPSAVAAVVCVFGAVAAVASLTPLAAVLDPFQRMAGGMVLRMGLPLCVVLWSLETVHSGPLAGTPFALYVVLFYLVTLTVEVCWSASQLSSPRSGSSLGSQGNVVSVESRK